MNGADALIETLLANEVDACFANPGTSEMQFVAALDRQPTMRPVLCLFEGVATGAADGFGRMADRPACTLLHLGPGYGNGLANLHNARRAYTPLVNVVGDHATYHRQYDAPLNSDIPTIVGPNSLWVKSADSADDVAGLAAEAVAASFGPPGGPVSLILPADSAWTGTKAGSVKAKTPERPAPSGEAVEAAARAIRAAKKTVLLIGGQACRAEAMVQAARPAAHGVRVLADTFVARQGRGAGLFQPGRMQYFGEAALADLAGTDLMLLAGTTQPVAFFAYPDRPSLLVPEGCELMTLAARSEDAAAGLRALADALDAADISLIRLATPTTDDKRLPVVLRRTSGFVYYVSVTGVTGAKEADAEAVRPAVARIRAASGLPVAVGFGIRTPERAGAIAQVADAAVVGSALVDEVAEALAMNEDVTGRVLSKVRALAEAVRRARTSLPA